MLDSPNLVVIRSWGITNYIQDCTKYIPCSVSLSRNHYATPIWLVKIYIYTYGPALKCSLWSVIASHLQSFITSMPAILSRHAPLGGLYEKINWCYYWCGKMIRISDSGHYPVLMWIRYIKFTLREQALRIRNSTTACWYIRIHYNFEVQLHAAPGRRRLEKEAFCSMWYFVFFLVSMESCISYSLLVNFW